MKKVFVFLVILAVFIGAVCLANDSLYEKDKELVNYIDESSGTVVDNYDDFVSVKNGGDTQSEMKEFYREFLKYSRDQDAENTKKSSVRAKVVDVNPTKTTYSMSYYTPYKIMYQPVKVEILEGEYEGKVVDVDYLITADSYDVLKIPAIRHGGVIFVETEIDEKTGDLVVSPVSYDVRVSRLGIIVFLAVVTMIVIIACCRLQGLKFVLAVVLIFDMVFLITLPQIIKDNEIITISSTEKGFPSIEKIKNDVTISVVEKDAKGSPTKVEIVKKSNSFIWLILLDLVVISAVLIINNLGLDKKALYAFVITCCTLVVMLMFVGGINYLTMMNGNSFEAISAAENIINKNIDFSKIYMLVTLIIASVVVSNTVSDVFLNYRNDNFKENIRGLLTKQFIAICVVIFGFLLSKIIVLIMFKYSVNELLNSEIILSEFVRLFALIIFTSVVVPVTNAIAKAKFREIEENDNKVKDGE